MREAWRLQKHTLHDHLVHHDRSMSVFFLYVGKELPPYQLIFSKMGSVVKRLSEWKHEDI